MGEIAPSGEQVEISFDGRRAIVVEVGGGLLSYADFAKDYRNVADEDARMIVVEAGPELFAMFVEND
jgi:hypothetical protein